MEFSTAAELTAHYSQTRNRLRSLGPPVVEVKRPVIIIPITEAKPDVVVIKCICEKCGKETAPPDTEPQLPKFNLSIRKIVRFVSVQENVPIIDLLSARRTQTVVRPRQIVHYLARKLTLKSLPEIGRHCGGRDHTTCLHSIRKIEFLRSCDPILDEKLNRYTEMLRGPNV